MRCAILTALFLSTSTLFAQSTEPAPIPPPSETAPATPSVASVSDSTNVVTLRPEVRVNWWDEDRFSTQITLNLVKADLQTTAAELSRESGMSLIVAHSGTKSTKKITLHLKRAPLRDVMLAIANLYDLTWFEQGRVYVLTYLTKKDREIMASGRFVRSSNQPGMARPQSVGQPIPTPATPPRQKVKVIVPAAPKP